MHHYYARRAHDTTQLARVSTPQQIHKLLCSPVQIDPNKYPIPLLLLQTTPTARVETAGWVNQSSASELSQTLRLRKINVPREQKNFDRARSTLPIQIHRIYIRPVPRYPIGYTRMVFSAEQKNKTTTYYCCVVGPCYKQTTSQGITRAKSILSYRSLVVI